MFYLENNGAKVGGWKEDCHGGNFTIKGIIYIRFLGVRFGLAVIKFLKGWNVDFVQFLALTLLPYIDYKFD